MMTPRRRFLMLLCIIAIIICLVSPVVGRVGMLYGQESSPKSHADQADFKGGRASTGEAQILLDELYKLRRQVSGLKDESGAEPQEASEVGSRIEELEMRVRLAESRYRESLLESNERFTSESLALTGTWINWVAILFGLAITLIGVGNFLGSRQLRRELERDRADIKQEMEAGKRQLEEIRADVDRTVKEALLTMKTGRDRGEEEMSKFKSEIQDQRASSERTRAFVQAVAEHFFSDTLLELLSALYEGGILKESADKELRNKTKEVEARIFLRYPDEKRVEQAIRTLMALGSEAALPDLSEFASGVATNAELKRLAHLAIIRISERRGAAKATNQSRPGDRE